MKKGMALIVTVLLTFILVLSGCGTSKDESAGGKAAKTLKVATDAQYAPFESLDKDKVVGFDVDFVKAAAEEAGYKANVVNVGWDPLFVEVKQKKSDLAVSAITITDERKQTYDFSNPYYLSTNEILVPENSKVTSGADLKGKTVAVQNATTGQEVAESILGKNSNNIKKFKNNNLAILELLNGGADAVIADNGVVDTYVKNNPDKKLKIIKDESFPKEFYGLMFPKGSDLKADFDKAVKKLIDNGKYEEIYKKWFGTEPDIEKLKAQN
ncbi:MAG: basic amino acid ABC transporter substrate-binding protein [Tuberibacillus sp.]